MKFIVLNRIEFYLKIVLENFLVFGEIKIRVVVFYFNLMLLISVKISFLVYFKFKGFLLSLIIFCCNNFLGIIS